MFLTKLRSALLGAWLALSVLPAPLAAREALPSWPVPTDGVLANDPAVIWGRLGNGLRYAVLPGGAPPGRVSLRLLVEAGSLMEDEDQRGLAHFVEHMAFEGSVNLPPGELVAYLQRAGLAFGPDTNASTGFDTTVYQLDLPRNDDALVGEALGILSEIAGRLLLPNEEIEAERGVILSEKRLRDNPETRLFEATLAFLLPGTRYADRLPIGLEEVIRTAPRERLVEFYRDHYTPERSVVVVAGDVEPASVATAIERRFAGFPQPAERAGDPAFGAVADRGLDAALVSDPGLPTTLSLNTVLPHDPRPDSLAKQGGQFRELLGIAMLGRRLDSMALRPGAPFSQAGAGVTELPPVARVPGVRLVTTPDGWREALAAGEQELRRALEFGFSATELAEMLAILRGQLEAAAASASTREAGELAEQLVQAIADERVFTSPATDLVLFDELARGLQPADVDRAMRGLWGGGREPQIILAGPIRLAEPKAEILAAYRGSRAVPVAPPEAVAAAAFAYGDFGQPSSVAATEHVADLGITRVAFANGVRLDLKPTAFEADTVHLAVRFGTGRVGMPPGQPGLDLLAAQGFVAGGLGRHGIEEIDRILAARQVGVDLVVGDSGLVLVGRTTRRDLPLQLDLLAAYVADPGYRPEAMDQHRQRLEAAYARMAAAPEGAVPGPVELLLHGGDARFAVPPKAEAARRTLAELRLWLEPMLRQGPLQVVVVGDVDPAQAIAEVGRTFGALPPRGSAPAARPPEIRLPAAGEPVRFTHAGAEDQALALVYWPTTGQGDPRAEIGLDLVADILADRLLREVREREGATYSPEVYSDMSLALPGYGRLGAGLDVAAGDAARLVQVIREVAAGMHAGGITQDELDRAMQPRLAQARLALQHNGYWLQRVLLRVQRHPRALEEARSLVANHEAQTLASVQALATRYLDPARALPVLVLPAAMGAASASGVAVGDPAPAAVR